MSTPRTNRLDAAAERLGDPDAWSAAVLRAVLLTGIIVGSAVLFAVSLAPSAQFVSAVTTSISDQLFDFPPLPEDLAEQSQRSVVLDREGNELAVLRVENRKVVRLSQVPEHVEQAVIATEDTEFRSHEGVNWRAVTRAALGNVAAGEITGGGSTITQQVVKNLVVGDAVTFDRKLQEAVYAIELERRLTKDEILQLYLNEAYFANGVYGVGTAAEYYWGKDVTELTIPEGALLAGMIRIPEGNDPVDNPEAAVQRRNIVLGQMADEGSIAERDLVELQATPLELDIQPLPEPTNPFFIDYVRSLLEQEPALGDTPEQRWNTALRGGLTIATTLHPQLQSAAREVIAETLDGPDDPLGALTAVDPRTGEILAIGFGPKEYGKGPDQTEVNPAVPGLGGSGRQAGSAFKAFQIVAALEDDISPGYTFDAGSTYSPENPACPPDYEAENYGGEHQGVLNMAEATARSSNTYFLHLLDLTGPEKLVEVAHRMGIDSKLEPFCSLVLGGQDVFPLEMASAFGTLANAGTHCEPYAIAEVRDRRDRVVSRGGGNCEDVVDRDIAARATALLRGSIEGGTASRHGSLDRPAAGKTGTTNEAKDAWFVGYIPQLSTASWVGHETPETMEHPACGGQVTGGCLPTMIWQRFMSEAVETMDFEVVEFPEPPPLPSATVPSVVGRSQGDAAAILEDAGFRAVVEVVADWRAEGLVIDQSPGGGGSAPEGSAVTIVVSNGAEQIPAVPDMVGMGLEAAQAALSELGLSAEVQRVPVTDSRWYGVVFAQSPDGGAPAYGSDGAQVGITLRAGRPAEPGETPETVTAGTG